MKKENEEGFNKTSARDAIDSSKEIVFFKKIPDKKKNKGI
jgi:hypothetical protein